MRYRLVRVHEYYYVEAYKLDKFLLRRWRRVSPRFNSAAAAREWYSNVTGEQAKSFEVIEEL